MNTDYDPACPRKTTVRFGKARFQVLTERMIRMEWAEDGLFEDRPTLAVANRRTRCVKFTSKTAGNKLTLRTKYLSLRYIDDGKRFRRGNLSVEFNVNGRPCVWFPGKKDAANLKGTARTLDEVAGGKVRLCDGFVSRSGWAVVDESQSIVLDAAEHGRPWPTRRHGAERADLYLLAHGHDYKAALRDAALVFGRQPLPPRFTLGYWWSRYWAYTDKELEELVEEFDRRGLPIDVLVVDMDWHLEGWTGYTWDRRYFPDPKEFLSWAKAKGLKVTLNLHPADGVGRHEEQFANMARALGLKPDETDKVEFDPTDPRFMDAYFKFLHHPQEDTGVDFWWMDWQQGTRTKMKGLDALPWLNHLHWKDMEERRRDRRPLIFSRFGGIGAGRYPIGFSGDTYSIWESLAFQPYFTATASNVLFGYWSHDIGGHMPGAIEPELYTRWMQFGLYSPILRTHTTRNDKAERRVWEYPEPYSKIMCDVIRRRYEIAPYVYTENRKCFDTGVSLCRPMYYDHPESNEAYAAKGQYMFGDSFLVAPVVTPAEASDGTAAVKVWLPEGEWFDTALGRPEKGNRTIKRRYTLDEIPVFVRPGTVIPGQKPPARLNESGYKELVVTAYPGADGSYDLYEDDGASRDYLEDRFAFIRLEQKERRGGRKIVLRPARGSFPGFLRKRSLEIRIPFAPPPAEVNAGKRRLQWSYRLKKRGWTYDGDTATTIIRLPAIDVTKGITVEAASDPRFPPELVRGMKGLMTRLEWVRKTVTVAAQGASAGAGERLAVEAAQTGNRISRNPRGLAAEISRLREILDELPRVLRSMKRTQKDAEKKKLLAKCLKLIANARAVFLPQNR